jgi:hypothetical protein
MLEIREREKATCSVSELAGWEIETGATPIKVDSAP